MDAVNTRGIQDAGRFRPGQSGNPAGKPKGARNRHTRAAELLLDGESEAITRRCIEMAKEGDRAAMRLVMERIIAPRRERPLTFDVPRLRSLADISAAYVRIVESLGKGEILPSEASTLAGIIEAARKSIESEQLEARVQELEKAIL
jgi:hypothetical protein